MPQSKRPKQQTALEISSDCLQQSLSALSHFRVVTDPQEYQELAAGLKRLQELGSLAAAVAQAQTQADLALSVERLTKIATIISETLLLFGTADFRGMVTPEE